MEHRHFDIVILGGGAAGLFSASVARALGARVCIIEKKRLGGDCTWFGCMPSKAILKSAHVARMIRESERFGVSLQNPSSLDTSGVLARVRDVVKEIATHHEPDDLRKRGIDVIFGNPRFEDRRTLDVDGARIFGKRFILCTGSHPVVLPIDGLQDIGYLTNENIFDLNALPSSLIVLGGGPIGSEMSQALCRLGTTVSLVEMQERILFREEPELAGIVAARFKKEGINTLTGKKAVKAARKDGQVVLTLEDREGRREEIAAENILIAVGRAPNLSGLDLEKAGVECTDRGLKLNPFLQTTNPGVFACGDIASPYQFSHVAAYQASIAVRNAMFRRIAWQRVNYDNMAWATFTDPELAHLGLTEHEAREKYAGIRVYTTPYTNADRAVTDADTEGLVKVITDKRGLILGAHIVGAGAGEIIQGFLIAKSQAIPLSKIAQTMFIYPTLSELIKKTAAKPFVETGNHPAVKLMIKILRSV